MSRFIVIFFSRLSEAISFLCDFFKLQHTAQRIILDTQQKLGTKLLNTFDLGSPSIPIDIYYIFLLLHNNWDQK